MPAVKSYSILPGIYEHLMRKIDYDLWADYILDIIDEYEIDNYLALEFGSGNCRLIEYIRPYFRLAIATDLSAAMLKQFHESDAPVVCCDMRYPPFDNKFDLILAAFDTVNYLQTEDDFLKFLRASSELLGLNGIITFDASMPANSEQLVKRLSREGNFNGFTYIQKSNFNPNYLIHKNKFIIRDENGNEFVEEHIQRIFEFNDYFKMIEKTDLYPAGCWDAFSFKDADENSKRIQFVLRKQNI